VREVCVVPVKHQFGEVPKAFVTLKVPDPNANATGLAEEIKSFANGKLILMQSICYDSEWAA